MALKCIQCGAAGEDAFDVCWQCGSAKDGSIDPEFQHADSFEPEIEQESSQFSMAWMLSIVTALCLVFAAVGLGINNSANVIAMPLGIVGFGFLALQLIVWWLMRRFNRVRRQIREDARLRQDEHGE